MSQSSATVFTPANKPASNKRLSEFYRGLGSTPYDDEIDLLELIKAVLRTWKIWLIAAFLVTIIYSGFQIAAYLQASKVVPYTKVIALTFKGAERGQYPSGASYRLQDIISPAVLQTIYRQQGLDQLGLSEAEFQKRVTIEPYTPFYREIIAKYEALLLDKNLSAERIQAIQDSKSRELNQALSNNAIITLDVAGLDLEQGSVESTLQAIPEEWARQAIVDKGVLKTDIQLISAETLNDTLFQGVDYVVLSDLFADKIKGLQDNIDKVKSLEGSATIKDPETGWSLSDLEHNLHDLEVYTIDELMSPIRSLGLSRNPKLAAFYYEEKRKVLEEQLAVLEDEGKLIKSAYDAYSPNKPMETVVDGRQQAAIAGYPLVPQVGGEVLDKLLQVAGEDNVEKYRQVLNDRWLNTNMEMAETKGQLRSIERLIAAVKGHASDSLTEELRDEYLRRAEKKLPMIIAQLRDYYNINWRIYEQISRDRVGSVGYLYKDAHQGVLRGSTGISIKRIVLIYVALMAAMTFVVVPVVMIRNAMRDRALKEAELLADAPGN